MATYTYNFATNYQISIVRLMVADTGAIFALRCPGVTFFIFQDQEILAALQQESSQNLFISAQSSPTALGNCIPAVPQIYSYYRAAALLLDSLAANKAYLSSILKMMDVTLSNDKAAAALRAEAEQLRNNERSAGNFAIAEVINNQFQGRERVIKQWLRLFGS